MATRPITFIDELDPLGPPDDAGTATALDASNLNALQDALIFNAPADSTRNVIQPSSAAAIPVTIKGASSQTADLLTIKSSGNVEMASFDKLGRLAVTADPGDITGDGDSISQITLANRTSNPLDGTAGSTPAISWLVDYGSGPVYKWQTAVDAWGLDLVLGYHKGNSTAPTSPYPGFANYGPCTGLSGDVIRLTGEDYPRIGVHNQNPDANSSTHLVSRMPSRAAVFADMNPDPSGSTVVDGWALKVGYQGSVKGGFWYDSAGVGLKLGVGLTSEPAYPLDVIGTSNSYAKRFAPSSTYTTYANDSTPLMYPSSSGGSYPFDAAGNLIIQPRSEHGGATKDIVLATGDAGGSGDPSTILIATGSTQNIGLFGMTSFGTSSKKVLGLGNVSAAPTGNPTGGAVMWIGSSVIHTRDSGGGGVAFGQVRSYASGFGMKAASSNTVDTSIGRVAADVIGVGSASGLTAPTMTGAGLMLANVSAAPSTNPVGGGVLYCESGALKYRGTSGTITTIANA